MHHQMLAKKLQETQTIKHAKTQAKLKTTAVTNKAKKQAQQAEMDVAEQLQLAQDEHFEELEELDSDNEDGQDEIPIRPQKQAHIDII